MLPSQASSETQRRSDSMDKEKAVEEAVAPEPNKQTKNTGKSTKGQLSKVSDSTLGVVSNINKKVLLILRDLNNNVNKQKEKVEAQNTRIEKISQKLNSMYYTKLMKPLCLSSHAWPYKFGLYRRFFVSRRDFF